MFVELWIYQKPLWTHSSWSEQTKRIRCWSKSNSGDRICQTIKQLDNDGNATNGSFDQNLFGLTILDKIKKNMTKSLSKKCNILAKDRVLWRIKS